MIIFLSLKMFFRLFLYGIIYWIFKNIPLEIVGGWLKSYEYVRDGGGARSMRTCAYDGGGGGQIFVIFGAYVLTE